jgi:probable FeS assembly SUF system protein SufT
MTMYGQSEPVTLARDVKAVVIPAGDETILTAGRSGFITQALGGSFTVYVDGNLFRVSGADADALGKAPRRAPELPPGATDADVERLVWDQLRTCFDPEIPINIVDLGLVYECRLEQNEDGSRGVKVKMTLTAPGCGMGEILVQDVRDKLSLIPTLTKIDVELVFDPPWSHNMMSEAARLQTGMMY